MVTHTGEILYTSAADKNDRVLLQFVSDTGNISGYLIAVGDFDSGYLSHSGVRLLGSLSSYSGAHAALLGRVLIDLLLTQSVHTILQCGCLGFLLGNLTTLADQLIKRRHYFTSKNIFYARSCRLSLSIITTTNKFITSSHTFIYFNTKGGVCQGFFPFFVTNTAIYFIYIALFVHFNHCSSAGLWRLSEVHFCEALLTWSLKMILYFVDSGYDAAKLC